MLPETFRCFLVTKDAAERVTAEITRRPLDELPAGDVILRVAYSSLNYKDALAVTGHPGVNKVFPHVPGVDAAGTVVASQSASFARAIRCSSPASTWARTAGAATRNTFASRGSGSCRSPPG